MSFSDKEVQTQIADFNMLYVMNVIFVLPSKILGVVYYEKHFILAAIFRLLCKVILNIFFYIHL